MAPKKGPIQYTYQLSKNCATTAGPNHRAGFIAAPVSGPPIMMSIEIVRPMAKPPTALKVPFGSIPVPYTTVTRKNVRIASTRIPVTTETFQARPGVDPSAAYRCGVCLVSRSNPRTSSRDVRGGSAVETPHEFEAQFRRLPGGIREDEVREESRRVTGDLSHESVHAEQGLEDPMGLLPAHALVHESERVEILVQEDVKRVRFVQRGVRLLDSEEGHLVHHDHVARDRIERTEETLRMVAEVCEGEHEPCSGPSEHRFDRPFHELEEVRQVLRLVEFAREIHRCF